MSFCAKHAEFHVDTKNSKKMLEKDFRYLGNLTGIGNGKLSLLLRDNS